MALRRRSDRFLRGDGIPAGTKSPAYALMYRTMDKAHGKIAGRLKHVLGASIRGK